MSFAKALAALSLVAFASSCGSSAAAGFSLSSADIAEGRPMSLKQEFNGFDGRGENLCPALSWSQPPAGTKSFAVTVYDPDAPTGSGWWHYLLVDLPADTRSLPQGFGTRPELRPPQSREVRNDYGLLAYGGPCPPKGDKPHRYIFTVHALKVDKLALPDGASAALAGFMINANCLGKASITSVYGR
ncbi:MAG: hypothetical protein RL095_2321 [Verrucomicrobiota bacterium]|jgi:Raf kinase inhibitor-like YbhB/YbcL family protein